MVKYKINKWQNYSTSRFDKACNKQLQGKEKNRAKIIQSKQTIYARQSNSNMAQTKNKGWHTNASSDKRT